MEPDRRQQLRAGGGCFLVLALLFAAAFGVSWTRLQSDPANEEGSVYPLLWPIWKAFGDVGVLTVGVLAVVVCSAIGALALIQARRPG